MVLFLIQRHLDLSSAMQSRDMFDPQTIADVARQVETVERLKALTLLTHADIAAVNPQTMTPWRSQQLWQLYLMVYNELTRPLESDRIDALPSGPPERVDFLKGFPTRYLRTHTEAEIDGHIALEEKSQKRGVAVEVRKLESAWQLTMVAADRPGMFASMAGTLSSFGMNILKAEAFSNRQAVWPRCRVHVRRSNPHARSEPHRSRPPASNDRAGDYRQDRCYRVVAEPAKARVTQPQSPYPGARVLRFGREPDGHSDRDRGRRPSRLALRFGIGNLFERREHRGCLDRYRSA